MVFNAFHPLFTTLSFRFGLSSYLGYPRINFQGHFRADSNTHNNDVCNYRDAPIPVDHYVDWNSQGTNEFEFGLMMKSIPLAGSTSRSKTA